LPSKTHSLRTVLIASTGLSPAVLTETIWALAQEEPRVIPDTVVVLTTVSGARQVREQLFGEDEIWQQLRRAILGRTAGSDSRLDFDTTSDRLKVVTCRIGERRQPIDELATPEQNAAFADAVTQELWAYTSQTDVRVIASLAGGFKTMGALMLSAMQLLANPGDRVTHVLVSGGYDCTQPAFFFPAQRRQLLRGRDGATLRAMAAARHLRLIDLPVIPFRRWFEQILNRRPPSYQKLIDGSVHAIEHVAGDNQLELGPVVLASGEKRHWLKVAGERHHLSPAQYAYLRFLAERAVRDPTPAGRVQALVDELTDWVADSKDREPRFHSVHESLSGEKSEFDGDDFCKRMNDLRVRLGKLPGGSALASILPAKGHWGLHLSKDRITLH
jgi:CRISPR-associated protein (TIGR02584 family)